MRAYAVLSNVSSRLAAIPSILRQASGRRPAPRPPSGHQADAARICLMPDWPRRRARVRCPCRAGPGARHGAVPAA